MRVASNGPSRPALRWFGGKWVLAPRIIAAFPPHRIYVEPFGGAASILLRKPRAYAEVYNDLDHEAVNLFRVLRDPVTADRLIGALRLTPYAREEFEAAYGQAAEPVEKARRLIIRSFMGFGADGATGSYRTGFRANSNRSGTTPSHDWVNYPPALLATVERLSAVVIENRDAIEVMRAHGSAETLHYVDPPYVHSTRKRTNRGGGPEGGVYRHEMTDPQHVALLEALLELKGMVVLSGYPCPLYEEFLAGWRRVELDALADGAAPRTEVLWISPAAAEAAEGPLFVRDFLGAACGDEAAA